VLRVIDYVADWFYLSSEGTKQGTAKGGWTMFALNIQSTFGDTIDCRINGKPKRVTWRDEHTLVIETDPYATAPVDTDKFGANWTGLETLASRLRDNRTASGTSAWS
jgi:hypothetical protein